MTTFCEMYNALRAHMATGDLTVGQVSKGDRMVTYRSLDDFLKLLALYKMECQIEQGLNVRRTYASNGGRGE